MTRSVRERRSATARQSTGRSPTGFRRSYAGPPSARAGRPASGPRSPGALRREALGRSRIQMTAGSLCGLNSSGPGRCRATPARRGAGVAGPLSSSRPSCRISVVRATEIRRHGERWSSGTSARSYPRERPGERQGRRTSGHRARNSSVFRHTAGAFGDLHGPRGPEAVRRPHLPQMFPSRTPGSTLCDCRRGPARR